MVKNIIIVLLSVISLAFLIFAFYQKTEAERYYQEALNYKYVLDERNSEVFDLSEQLSSCRDSLRFSNN